MKTTHPYVSFLSVNPFNNDILDETINFDPFLNLLGGENGTGKTKILVALKAGSGRKEIKFVPEEANLRIVAFSPKRNSERQSTLAAFQLLRRESKNLKKSHEDLLNKAINDNTFQPYSSFVETFVYVFEERCKDGTSPKAHMTAVTTEFNKILRKTFPKYKLISEWNDQNGSPDLFLKKGKLKLEAHELSCGEQEVFSLIFNLYSSRKNADLYLIDEPEIHLNWSLEHNLFKFFDWFCKSFKKQMIVTTHSRVALKDEFYEKCKFLTWDQGKIVIKENISPKERELLAGEVVSLISKSILNKKVFFVEDKFQKEVIESLNKRINPDENIDVIVCGNKSNVKSLFRLSYEDPNFTSNAFFVLDGDGEGNPFPNEKQFIFLKKYCLECYFFNLKNLSKTLGKTELQIKGNIYKIIKDNSAKIFKKTKNSKFIEQLITKGDKALISEEILSDFDCSELIKPLLKQHKKKFSPFLKKYISVKEEDLVKIFDDVLIKALKN